MRVTKRVTYRLTSTYLMLMPERKPSACACCRDRVDAAALRSNPMSPSNGVNNTSVKLLSDDNAGRTVVMWNSVVLPFAASAMVMTRKRQSLCWWWWRCVNAVPIATSVTPSGYRLLMIASLHYTNVLYTNSVKFNSQFAFPSEQDAVGDSCRLRPRYRQVANSIKQRCLTSDWYRHLASRRKHTRRLWFRLISSIMLIWRDPENRM